MEKPKLIQRFAERYSVDATKLLDTLKLTAFRQRDGSVPTNEQMMTLMVVADQYGLNPFTKEIFAFPDKSAGIIPVVGVDGWSRIINQHAQFDGMDFRASTNIVQLDGAKPCPEWMECIIYRKDRAHPVKVTEYIDEVYRAPFEGTGKNGAYKVASPWQTHTKRMLRHKATIQASRLAFGFVGIYDNDEAERIMEGHAHVVTTNMGIPESLSPASQTLTNKLIQRAIASGAWNSVFDYASEHFSGGELFLVQQQLLSAKNEHLQSVEDAKTTASSSPSDATLDDVQAIDA